LTWLQSSNNHIARVGLLGLYHESNTFISQPTTMQNFREGHLYYGDSIIKEYKEAFHEIGGIIEIFEQHKIQLVPVMYANATPGGIIDKATSEDLISELIEHLDAALPLDGLMVVPHGAAVSEISDDYDGYWLDQVRKLAGQIPIVGTLDPHANLSQRMVDNVEAFVAYKSNPHVDQREVGKEAALIMVNTLAKKVRPMQKMIASGIAIELNMQNTASEPCLSLYRLAAMQAEREGVLSVSILLGFPYADVVEMGSSFLVVTDQDSDLAERVLAEMEGYIQNNQGLFRGNKISIEESLGMVEEMEKPVLLLDMGDNIGAGSPGDSTFILHALEVLGKYRSFLCINDPESVRELSTCKPGDWKSLVIGGKTDTQHGKPLETEVQLKQLTDGRFSESEPRHGGQVNYDMGPTAIVETSKGTSLMLTSRRTAPFSLQKLLHLGIEPSEYDILVAKGVQAPMAAYAPVCPSAIHVNTPGVTTVDMLKLSYQKRRRPLYPFEES
jgi:microcystin degradation protein MlrC